MKNMLIALLIAASPAASQEFASEAPAVRDILSKARALQASSPALHKAAMQGAENKERCAKLLDDVEKIKDKIQKRGDDSTLVGIYHADLSLIYMKLALELPCGAGAPSAPQNAAAKEAECKAKQARLPEEIARMKEKINKYEADPLRVGIYTIELGLLQMELALANAPAAR